MEKQRDTVLKPYYVEKSMDIMPFDAPNFENMKFPHYWENWEIFANFDFKNS